MSTFPRDNTYCQSMTREGWSGPLYRSLILGPAFPFAIYAAQQRADQHFKACMESRGYSLHRVNEE